MLDIPKKIIVDENQTPIAVQIPIEEYERLEEMIENYGLAKLMDEVRDDETLSLEDAKKLFANVSPTEKTSIEFSPNS